MATTEQIRQNMVALAQWGIENAASIHYAEVRPIPLNLPVHHLPFTTDCSGWVTMIAKWAGAPDPNGAGYDGSGFTGTLLSHLPHIEAQEAKRGDFVVYGPGTGEHVVMLLADVANHPNPPIASHGEESAPSQYSLSQETSFFKAGTQLTFLQTVYDCRRNEATGDSSLDQVADSRSTHSSHIIEVTKNSHKYGQGMYGIGDGNLAKFTEYVQGGTDKNMPKGLVFYTTR